METGPYCLMEDDNFVYIFQHCAHFIASVNLFEENDKEADQKITSASLLLLKQTCHECLQLFNDLNKDWVTINDAKLNTGITETTYLIDKFKKIMETDVAQLDFEAKNKSLPGIVNRLGLIIETFILHRERLTEKKQDAFLLQFDHLYKNLQRSAQYFIREITRKEDDDLNKIKRAPER